MQYYPSLTNATANVAMITILIDPILQNSVLASLFIYVIKSADDGGCCESRPLYRATLTLLVLYCFWLVLNAIGTTMVFTKILKSTDQEGGINKKCFKVFCIALLSFFNLHIFTFGFVLSAHRYFDLQRIYHAIRASIQRNVIQIILQFTIIGLIAMNVK